MIEQLSIDETFAESLLLEIARTITKKYTTTGVKVNGENKLYTKLTKSNSYAVITLTEVSVEQTDSKSDMKYVIETDGVRITASLELNDELESQLKLVEVKALKLRYASLVPVIKVAGNKVIGKASPRINKCIKKLAKNNFENMTKFKTVDESLLAKYNNAGIKDMLKEVK